MTINTHSLKRFALKCVLILSPFLAHAESSYTLSVTDYGAKADAKTDNTAAFQQAIDACARQNGGIVTVPAGSYRFDGNLKIPANVTLKGTFSSAPTGNLKQMVEGKLGSALLVHSGRNQPDGPAFIELTGSNAAVQGLAFGYPEWDPKVIPPVAYPPTIAVDAHGRAAPDNVAVQDCIFVNSWEAIRFINAGRHLIRNITGYPIKRGIYVDQIWDVGRIENVHFWPFGHRYSINDPYSQWINEHGVAIEIGFSDWQIISNCFSFGYGTGYLFSASDKPGRGFGRGSCGKMVASGVDCAKNPIVFQDTYSHWLISSSEFVGRWGEAGTTVADIGPGVRGRITFSNCAFWGPVARVALMRAPEGILALDNCQIETWDDSVGAIQVDEGRVILQGNSFDREGQRHLMIGKHAGPVVATGNLAWPFFDIRTDEQNRFNELLLAANQTDKLSLSEQDMRHYFITIGAPGDSRYIDNWHPQENIASKTRRWSRGESLLNLPVVKNVNYEVVLQVNVPASALSKNAGVYLGDQRLLPITKEGNQKLRFTLPAHLVKGDKAALRIVSAPWRPADLKQQGNHGDHRVLGISLERVEVISRGSESAPAFNAGGGNGSTWVPQAKRPR